LEKFITILVSGSEGDPQGKGVEIMQNRHALINSLRGNSRYGSCHSCEGIRKSLVFSRTSRISVEPKINFVMVESKVKKVESHVVGRSQLVEVYHAACCE
jgi:hypothetical protein